MCPNVLTSEKKNVPTSCRAALQWPLCPATNTLEKLILLQLGFNHALQQQRLQQWGAGDLGLVTRILPGILCQVCGETVVSVKTSFPFVITSWFTGHTFVFTQTSKWNGVSKWGLRRQDSLQGECCAQLVLRLLLLKEAVRVCMASPVGLHFLSCVFS